MGSESTSEIEVKNSKWHKRAKKKNKSKEDYSLNEAKSEDVKIDQTNEENVIHKEKKRKKRKKNSQESNNTKDEAVNNEEQHDLTSKKHQSQEKTDNGVTPTKKLKHSSVKNDGGDQVNEEMEENDQSETKPSKTPSNRQLKREKHEKRENEKKEASRQETIKKALNYVSKWKHARSEWKFEKLKQIWLIDNLLDESAIPGNVFPTVLEYFEGCKGMAREQLLKKGMGVIKKVEDDEENRDELMESVAYKRARELLQALPTET